MSNQTFAELFADARHQAGLKPTQFALLLGIGKADVSRYEAGTRVPYSDRFFQICDKIGIDPRVAAEARALSLEQQAAKGKSNAVHRAALASAYARSCRKRPQPVSELVSGLRLRPGECYCFGVKFSSRGSMLKVCREEKGDRRCQVCEVLRSGGMDAKALGECNITFLEANRAETQDSAG